MLKCTHRKAPYCSAASEGPESAKTSSGELSDTHSPVHQDRSVRDV